MQPMLNNLTYLYQGLRTNNTSNDSRSGANGGYQTQQTHAQHNPSGHLLQSSNFVQHQRDSSLDAARQMYAQQAKRYAKASTGTTQSTTFPATSENFIHTAAQKQNYYTQQSHDSMHDGEENAVGDSNDENCQWRANSNNNKANLSQQKQLSQQQMGAQSQRVSTAEGKIAPSACYNTTNSYGNPYSGNNQQQAMNDNRTYQHSSLDGSKQRNAQLQSQGALYQQQNQHSLQSQHTNHQNSQKNQQPGYMMKATTDSPPSCSLTASPARTTEKKMLNIGGCGTASSNNIAPSGPGEKQKIAAVQISSNSSSSQHYSQVAQQQAANANQYQQQLSTRSKMAQLNFPCNGCNAMHSDAFIEYTGDSEVGNCETCGAFYNLKAATQALQTNRAPPSKVQLKAMVSHSIRDQYQAFRTEVPMDLILLRLVEDAEAYTPQYNKESFYMTNRELFVEWMFDLAERLRVQPETFHHSVNIFDAYLMTKGIESHLDQLEHFQSMKKTPTETQDQFQRNKRHNVVTLIAMASLFISAKYLEKTYPGIVQLLKFVGVPFSYEDFVAHEKDMLEQLGWQLQFISSYNVLSHFLCQGILFSSDRIIHVQNASETRPNLYTAQVLQHNCEIFTSMCLKKHEFLKYDQLTLVCAIIMAARKVCLLQELWPEELQSMSGGIQQPQVKQCMRHIVSFYSEINCSTTNTQQSSPEHPSTVQKTAKRTSTTQAQASVSTKKKSRGNEKSQEQTTSKKQCSVTRIASQVAATYATQGKDGPVVTPAKNVLRNKLTNQGKSSCDKHPNMHGAKRNIQMSGINRSQSKGANVGTSQQQSTDQNHDDQCVKSTDSRITSQEPSGKSKATHTLFKQDSSKYLKQTSQDKILKRTQRATSHSTAGIEFKAKHVQNLAAKMAHQPTDRTVNISNQASSSGAYPFQAASTTQRTQNSSQSTQGASNTLNSYLYSQQQTSSLTKQISSKLSSQREHHGDSQTKSSSGAQNAGSTLKKVIPHPLLRVSDQSNGASLPPCLSNIGSTTNKQGSTSTVNSSSVQNQHLQKVKTSTNVETMKEMNSLTQNYSSSTVNPSSREAQASQMRASSLHNQNNSHMHSNSNGGLYSSTTVGGASTTANTKINSGKTDQLSGGSVQMVNGQSGSGNYNMIQQRSLLKQFESMDLVKNQSGVSREGSTGKYGGGSSSGFIVNSLTTASQRANSKSSSCSQSFVQKLVGQHGSKLGIAGAQTAGTPSGQGAGQVASSNGANHGQAAAMAQKVVYKSNNYLQSVRDSSQAQNSTVVNPENHNSNTNASMKMGGRNNSQTSNAVVGVQNQSQSESNPTNSQHNIQSMIQQQIAAQDLVLRNRVSENHHGSQTNLTAPKVIGNGSTSNAAVAASMGQSVLAGYKLQTQREASANSNGSAANNGQSKFDYSSIQALMANLKQTSASTATSGGSGAVNANNMSKNTAGTGYARSTSRGKEQQLAQANKLSAMLGRSGFGSNGIGGSSLTNRAGINNSNSAVNVAMSMFHPRPQNLRVKMKGATNHIVINQGQTPNMPTSSSGMPQNGVTPNAQIVQDIQRQNCYERLSHREK